MAYISPSPLAKQELISVENEHGKEWQQQPPGVGTWRELTARRLKFSTIKASN